MLLYLRNEGIELCSQGAQSGSSTRKHRKAYIPRQAVAPQLPVWVRPFALVEPRASFTLTSRPSPPLMRYRHLIDGSLSLDGFRSGWIAAAAALGHFRTHAAQ